MHNGTKIAARALNVETALASVASRVDQIRERLTELKRPKVKDVEAAEKLAALVVTINRTAEEIYVDAQLPLAL